MCQSLQRSWLSVKETSWQSLSKTQEAWKAGGSAHCTDAKASLLGTGWNCWSDPCSTPSHLPPLQLQLLPSLLKATSRRSAQGLRASTRCPRPSTVHSSRASTRFLLDKMSTKSHLEVVLLLKTHQARWVFLRRGVWQMTTFTISESLISFLWLICGRPVMWNKNQLL